MTITNAVLVRYDDPDGVAERAAVAGFLAGYERVADRGSVVTPQESSRFATGQR